MKLTMASSPHNHSHKSVNKIMMTVMAACIPGILVQTYYFGFGVLIQLALALITASLAEALVLKLRGRAIWPSLSDGSAWLTAVLLAISIPPLAPWWITVIGAFFAITPFNFAVNIIGTFFGLIASAIFKLRFVG